jgi:two-component system phosphate regulon sensor histidine kinase PhoR
VTELWLATFAGLLAALWLWRRAETVRREADLRSRQLEALHARAQAEADRLRLALGGASGGLIVLDEQTHVVGANPAARQLVGLPASDPVGKRIEELVPWPLLHVALGACRDERATKSVEVELNEGAESRRLISVRVSRLDGVGYAIELVDESRIRQLESIRRDFVANVSHELKTPLAAIKGFIETVQDDPDMPAATQARFLERVALQTQRLAALVSDLLTISRLDDDPELASGVPVDLTTVLRETVRDLLPLAERRELDLQLHLGAASVWVLGDHEALRQVFGNLVDNALKYTPERGSVTVRLLQPDDRTARVEVADTGIGLSVEDQQRVFERFYRVDRARSRELGGTGLGLSIVKNTARNLGGDVGVRSQRGVGSVFWVDLPRHRAEVGGGNSGGRDGEPAIGDGEQGPG